MSPKPGLPARSATGIAGASNGWRRSSTEKKGVCRHWRIPLKRSGNRGAWLGGLWRWLRWAILLGVVALLALGGQRAWQLYQRVQVVRQHVEALRSFSLSNLNTAQVEAAGEHLSALHTEMLALQSEAGPFLFLAPYLGWLPTYGGDLTQAPALLELGAQLSIMGDETFQAVSPLVPDVLENRNSISIPELLGTLKNADAQLLTAQVALSRARAARQQVQTERLSERVRSLLLEQVDPLLLTVQGAFPVDEVLKMARIAPRLLGAVENGPQTYLILIQNEDELRPTGGFITAVGRLSVEDGRLTDLSFEGVSLLDDFNKPYPSAPWQLDEYMRSEILILRDCQLVHQFSHDRGVGRIPVRLCTARGDRWRHRGRPAGGGADPA